MSTEAIILLDITIKFVKKTKYILGSRIIIYNDNWKLINALQNEIRKEYILTGEAGAKIVKIN